MLNIEEILNLLPHRYPFVLVDRVLAFTKQDITGLKNVTINENFFTGHFPQKKVMPGVLLLEAMAQLSAILVCLQEKNSKKLFYFLAAEQVKFRSLVIPGDTIHIFSQIHRQNKRIWQFQCHIKVNDKIVAEAMISGSMQ